MSAFLYLLYNATIITGVLLTKGVVMRTMNEILVDIVLAVGGTVTDKNNRNQLLNDWLSAI